MNRAHTELRRFTKAAGLVNGFRTAISLHSHTYYSKESLGFIPHYLGFHRTPIVSGLFHSEMKNYEERTGKTLDFDRAYWTPPVSPSMVVTSELRQIEGTLGLPGLVSITDHDTIAAPLALRAQPTTASVPVSVEWTIPFRGNSFHIGVHHLPPDSAVAVVKELGRYTQEPAEERLRDLFALLDSFPETLLVLNHPFHNIYRVPSAAHLSSLRQLVAFCRPWIHAVEFNGMRSFSENQDVLAMAEDLDLPIVAGGDRHGCHSNTLLNLSPAEAWEAFIASVRNDRRNTIVILPAFDEPAPLRELATACDVVRDYPRYPQGRRRYTDRIFVDMDGVGLHPLSYYWDGGGKPAWLSPVILALIALGNDHVRPILSWLLPRASQFDRTRWPRQGGESDQQPGLD